VVALRQEVARAIVHGEPTGSGDRLRQPSVHRTPGDGEIRFDVFQSGEVDGVSHGTLRYFFGLMSASVASRKPWASMSAATVTGTSTKPSLSTLYVSPSCEISDWRFSAFNS